MKNVILHIVCIILCSVVFGCNVLEEEQNGDIQPTVFSEDKIENITIDDIKSGNILDNVYYRFTGKILDGGYKEYGSSGERYPYMLICDVKEVGKEDINCDGVISDLDIDYSTGIHVSFFAESEIDDLKQLKPYDIVTVLATSSSIGEDVKKIDYSYLESFRSNTKYDFENIY